MVSRAVDRFLAGKKPSEPTQSAAAPAATPPAAARPTPVPPIKPRPVDFVSEAEIRAAVKHKSKIIVGPKTIITPAARDLAAEYDVLVRVD